MTYVMCDKIRKMSWMDSLTLKIWFCLCCCFLFEYHRNNKICSGKM
uniref:Uncharacterized protein n=1 Tax=Anguilla anguilla TaxID=7936 RepID=A0A0E9V8H7_ANGAN